MAELEQPRGTADGAGNLAELFSVGDQNIERKRRATRRARRPAPLAVSAAAVSARLAPPVDSASRCRCHITCRRTDNLFKQLDERALTEEEERIIQQRVRDRRRGPAIARNTAAAVQPTNSNHLGAQVDLQRRLFVEYEKRERTRKVRSLLCARYADALAARRRPCLAASPPPVSPPPPWTPRPAGPGAAGHLP
jgi:hypothetical protein